jgi:hypothetical protein
MGHNAHGPNTLQHLRVTHQAIHSYAIFQYAIICKAVVIVYNIQMEKYLRGPVYIVHRYHNILTSLNLIVSRKHVINYCTPYQHLPIISPWVAKTNYKVGCLKHKKCTGGCGYSRIDSFIQRIKYFSSFTSSYLGSRPCRTQSTSSWALLSAVGSFSSVTLSSQHIKVTI